MHLKYLETLRFDDYGLRLRTSTGSKQGRGSIELPRSNRSCHTTAVGSRYVSRCRDYVNQNMSSKQVRNSSINEQEHGQGSRKSLTLFASSCAVASTSIRNRLEVGSNLYYSYTTSLYRNRSRTYQ